MNRLRGTACYLAGPMTDLPDLGVGWRQAVTPELQELGVVVLDPTNKPIDIGREGQEERNSLADYRDSGDFEGVRNFMKVIRRVDLRCIDLASFVIVRLDGTPTMGTYEEIALSVKEQKPTLIWLDGPLCKKTVNPWLLAQVDPEYIFESWDEIMEYLRGIDSSSEHPEDRRWMLFEFEDLYRNAVVPNLAKLPEVVDRCINRLIEARHQGCAGTEFNTIVATLNWLAHGVVPEDPFVKRLLIGEECAIGQTE